MSDNKRGRKNVEKKFDVIVVTDVLEIYGDIYLFLEK